MNLRRARAALLPLVSLAVLAAAPLALESSAAAQGRIRPGAGTKGETREDEPKQAARANPSPAPEDAPDPDKEASRAVYISGDIGFTRPDVGGLSDNTGFDKTAANGVLAGLGIGYRHRQLRVGARFRDQSTTQFTLWSFMGEVGYSLDFKPVSPVLFLHAGYMFDTEIQRPVFASSLPKDNILTPNVQLNGLVVGAELGASYWITKFLRVGPFIGLDFTFLHRPQVDQPQSLNTLSDDIKNNKLFGGSGSGAGYTINLGFRGTGDIGF